MSEAQCLSGSSFARSLKSVDLQKKSQTTKPFCHLHEPVFPSTRFFLFNPSPLYLHCLSFTSRSSPFEYSQDSKNAPRKLSRPLLGAVRSVLKSGGDGVEVADVAMVKTLPIQIDQFMNLNRNVLHYNSVEDGKGLCNGCLRRKTCLHRCSNCRLFWYCSNICQNEGYNKKYHKEICKILCDTHVQALFHGSWEQLDILQSFVLQGQRGAKNDKGSHLGFVLREMGHFLKV
ncbi:hypothetical protein BJX66DRAFT_335872 [Aspergillus keveii]|uniref:MYND-type domain-containing protein n=1 Tax=Aspergillus keveii TaxID=714993 RepID=A0ABR4GC89_9EURO